MKSHFWIGCICGVCLLGSMKRAQAQQPWPAENQAGPFAPAYPQPLPAWQSPAAQPEYSTANTGAGYSPNAYSPQTYPPVYPPAYPDLSQPAVASEAGYGNVPGPMTYPWPQGGADSAVAYPANTYPTVAPEHVPPPQPEREIVTDEVIVETEIVVPAVKWEHSFELGLNGSEGNTNTFNFRFGYDGERKTDASETTWSADYKFEENAGTTTVDELHFEGRQEWLFASSPWSVFVHSTYDFDQFTAYDSRFAADAGFGYQFFDDDINKLKGRVGSGASKEFGSDDDDWTPEMSFGLEYNRKLSDRQKLALSCEYYPEIRDFEKSWIVNKADWEILIDEAWNMSLKIGIRDRYDSTPSGSKHNDLDYSTVLLWKY